MRSCADVAVNLGLDVKDGYLPRECCDSCHDDASAGFDDLIWLDDDAQCCAIARLFDQKEEKWARTATSRRRATG